MKPTGAVLSTPSVPRKSRSPSAWTRPSLIGTSRRCDGAERDARAGDERLEQHVAGAQQGAVAAGRGVQAGLGDRPAGVDLAADVLAERARGLQRDQRLVGVVLVLVFSGACSALSGLGPWVQGKRPRLLDQVVAERVVRRLADEREALALVDAAGGVQDVVGPERERRIAARASRGG